ncbi:hypothetical protein WISP_116490 [Willisornis vidua]|uniref:Uncharacterized protein n=1 Tax=Willisornis vidua TaxID=1566151 RepID=A0ABQ9CUU6_9PASS|nr:hypothetical protein WISP_116490 [Willisornis vidua]
MDLMPASSKKDPTQVKAQPSNDGCGALALRDLRRIKTPCRTAPGKKGENVQRNRPADTQLSEEGGGRGASDVRVEILLQPMVQPKVRQLRPAVRGGPWWSRDPPAVPGECHTGASGCLKEVVIPWEAHAGVGSWQERLAQTGGWEEFESSSPREGGRRRDDVR